MSCSAGTRPRWGALALLCALTLPTTAQSVHVVAFPGGDFINLTQAVAGAAEGDVLLVHPSAANGPNPLFINGKSLVIVGEGSSRPVTPSFQLVGLAEDQRIVLRHLDVQSQAGPGVDVFLNDGAVWLEELTVRGDDGLDFTYNAHGKAGLRVRESAFAVCIDSDIVGGDGFLDAGLLNTPQRGGAGLHQETSDVALYGGSLTGGRGADHWDIYAGALGGLGVDASQSARLLISAGRVQGGGHGLPVSALPVHGIGFADLCTGFTLDSQVLLGPDSVPGDATDIAPGSSLTDLDDVARSIHLPAPMREGDLATLAYRGGPLDLVVLRISVQSQWLLQAVGLKGVDHLEPPTVDLVLGVADASGVLDVPLLIPDLPVGDEALLGHAQPFARALGGALRLGAPSHLLVIDETIPSP